MSETILVSSPASTEQAVQHLSTQEYVAETLHKHEVIDTDAVPRPAYVINGREVVFRNRQERPLFDDTDIVVPGGKLVYPLKANPEDSEFYRQKDTAEMREYVDDNQVNVGRIVVTNTPEGVLSAAALLVSSQEQSKQLRDFAESFSSEWGDEQRGVVDTLLAAVHIDDEGEELAYGDMDGWAVALAAFSGDQVAASKLDVKRAALLGSAKARLDTQRERGLRFLESSLGVEAEPVPLEQLALVHTTKHEVERDASGTIVLRPAGQHDGVNVPRASLHFTLNSRVGDVYTNGELQHWGDEQKMIVANLKQTVNAQHRLPESLDGIDTWFMLNPGEQLALPDALVVEPVQQTSSGKLIEQTDEGVQFVQADSYSAAEKDELKDLFVEYKTTNIKELALRIAMARVGVPVELMDLPSGDGHGMYDNKLATRIYATAAAHGLSTGKHFDKPESNAEQEYYHRLAGIVGKISLAAVGAERQELYPPSYIPLESMRSTLAKGQYPARPNALTDEALRQRELDAVAPSAW